MLPCDTPFLSIGNELEGTGSTSFSAYRLKEGRGSDECYTNREYTSKPVASIFDPKLGEFINVSTMEVGEKEMMS